MNICQHIASTLLAMHKCERANNLEWQGRHQTRIEALCKQYMPSGSGFDNGTKLNFELSTPERLVFTTSFHHMDENGFYDGWSTHYVIVQSSLVFGMRLRITGRDRDGWKDYAHETFHVCLSRTLIEDAQREMVGE